MVAPVPKLGGTATGYYLGRRLSRIEKRLPSYTGFKHNFGGKTCDRRRLYRPSPYWTRRQVLTDNFVLERAAIFSTIAPILAPGLSLCAGARWYTESVWIGGYAHDGSTAGASLGIEHEIQRDDRSAPSAHVRVAGQAVSGYRDYSLH